MQRYAKRSDKVCILVQQWCKQTVFVYKSAKYKHINLLKYKYSVTRYLKLWTLHMVHLSKLWCYSNRWLWVRLNFADVLKMERYMYSLFILFLFLGQKLTIVEQSWTLKGHFHWHVLTAKYSNYLPSYSGFLWNILLYK